MTWMITNKRLALGVALGFGLCGCGSGGTVTIPDRDDCAVRVEPLHEALRDTAAALEQAQLPLTGVAALQRDAEALCKAGGPPAACLGVAVGQLRSLERMLRAGVVASEDNRRVEWLTDAKLLSVAEALTCPASPQAEPGEAALRFQGELRCQRQAAPGEFEPLPDCNGASMRQGDRFQLRLTASQDAHVYVMIFNGSGQFQMPFPATPDDAHRVEAGVSYTLPADASWWPLDGQSGGLEHVLLVVSKRPEPALDALRGVDITPSSPDAPVAARARAKMEPIVARAVQRPDGSAGVALLKPDGQVVPVEQLFSEGADVAALEFTIDHVR